MSNIYEKDRSLLKPFTLYVLKGVLDAVSVLHHKGWSHHDLHGKNICHSSEKKKGIFVIDILLLLFYFF